MSIRFRVEAGQESLGLDQLLALRVQGLSRTRARELVAQGAVFANRKRVKVASKPIGLGHWVELHAPLEPPRVGEQVEQDRLLKLFEQLEVVDDQPDYTVLVKPSGLASAPTLTSDCQDVLHWLRQRDSRPTHLVHRLDQPTSGLLVVARSTAAAQHFGRLFATHELTRAYLALCFGQLPAAHHTVRLELDGKAACTHFERLSSHGPLELWRALLETGRTHQVRRHAESVGAPIVGDSKFGRNKLRSLRPRPPRLGLHATQLGFVDPRGQIRDYHSPLPASLASYAKDVENSLKPAG